LRDAKRAARTPYLRLRHAARQERQRQSYDGPRQHQNVCLTAEKYAVAEIVLVKHPVVLNTASAPFWNGMPVVGAGGPDEVVAATWMHRTGTTAPSAAGVALAWSNSIKNPAAAPDVTYGAWITHLDAHNCLLPSAAGEVISTMLRPGSCAFAAIATHAAPIAHASAPHLFSMLIGPF
jgi:hypothetical protein